MDVDGEGNRHTSHFGPGAGERRGGGAKNPGPKPGKQEDFLL